MKIEKIFFEQLFPTGAYANQRLGMEISFEDRDIGWGDSEETATQKAYAKAKALVEAAFQSLNPSPTPSITDYNTGPYGAEEQQVDRRIGVLADDIHSSPDLKTLESYKLIVKGNTELKTAYDKRLKELS